MHWWHCNRTLGHWQFSCKPDAPRIHRIPRACRQDWFPKQSHLILQSTAEHGKIQTLENSVLLRRNFYTGKHLVCMLKTYNYFSQASCVGRLFATIALCILDTDTFGFTSPKPRIFYLTDLVHLQICLNSNKTKTKFTWFNFNDVFLHSDGIKIFLLFWFKLWRRIFRTIKDQLDFFQVEISFSYEKDYRLCD